MIQKSKQKKLQFGMSGKNKNLDGVESDQEQELVE